MSKKPATPPPAAPAPAAEKPATPAKPARPATVLITDGADVQFVRKGTLK